MIREARAETGANPNKPEPGPLSSDNAVPTLIMAMVAMLGGGVAFYRKWKEGHVRAFNLVELAGEMFVSGVCGVLAWWLFRGFGVNEWLQAAGVGIVGHMGSRAMFLAEKILENVANKNGANGKTGTPQ